MFTLEQARQAAIDWQNWQADKNMSWGEISRCYGCFVQIVAIYPSLRNEFIENGII